MGEWANELIVSLALRIPAMDMGTHESCAEGRLLVRAGMLCVLCFSCVEGKSSSPCVESHCIASHCIALHCIALLRIREDAGTFGVEGTATRRGERSRVLQCYCALLGIFHVRVRIRSIPGKGLLYGLV